MKITHTWQICADSIGTKHYSGMGGQIDLIRGVSYSTEGKPIIALPSIASKEALWILYIDQFLKSPLLL